MRVIPIGELGRVVTGATPRHADALAWGDAVDFVTPGDMRAGSRSVAAARRLSAAGAARLSSRLLPAGATCVTCIGETIGKAVLLARPAITNQQVNSVVPDPSVVLPEFLYYLLAAHATRIAQAASGSATAIVNKRQFAGLAVRLPPLPEQARVAAILGALDDKIAASERTGATALSLAEALYERVMRDGPARHCRVASLAELRYGKALPAASRVPGEVPVYGSSGVVGMHDRALAPGPGIIIGRKGSTGTVHWSQRPCFPIDTVFYVADVDPAVPAEFLFFALRGLRLRALRTDSAVPGLTRPAVLAAAIALPSGPALRAFARQAAGLLALRDAVQCESARLAALRDALVPALVPGGLRHRRAASTGRLVPAGISSAVR